MGPRDGWISVSIEPTCIACDLCQTICPAVFVRTADGCRLRLEAADPEFLATHRTAIEQAAASCPVRAIKVTTQEAPAETGSPPVAGGASREPDVSGDAADSGSRMDRRRFATTTVGWVALAGSGAACLASLTRFMVPPTGGQGSGRIAAGPLARHAERPASTVAADFKPQGVWIVRLKDRIVAMSTACPHLGCVLNWEPSEKLFKCPCHGSAFDIEGVNLSGPAPTPMVRFGLSVEDGTLYVDLARTYRKERGQWQAPDSFWPLV